MVVLIHVLSALSSVAYTTWLIFKPSRRGVKFSYGLVCSTIASGTILIIFNHTNILSTCISGLLYIAAVSIGLAVVNRRLAAQYYKQR